MKRVTAANQHILDATDDLPVTVFIDGGNVPVMNSSMKI